MKLYQLLLLVILFFHQDLSASVPWVYGYSAGTVGYDQGRSVAFDSQGNYYLLGQVHTNPSNYLSDIDFGNGVSFTVDDSGFHCFIVKFNSLNQAQWVEKFIINGASGVNDIVIDNANNIFVLGSFATTATFGNTTLTNLGTSTYLAKFSSSGNFQWVINTTSPTNAHARCKDLETDGSNLYLTGYFKETQNFGNRTISSSGGDDIFLAKVSNSGSVLFFKQEGGSENAWGEALASDGNNIYLTGWYKGTASIAGTTLNSTGRADFFLAKYDVQGNPLWVDEAGSSLFSDYGKGVVADPATGEVYVSGRFGGTMNLSGGLSLNSTDNLDMFVAKYNSTGALLWAKQSTGTGSVRAGNMVFNSIGGGRITIYGSNTGEMTIAGNTLAPTGWLKHLISFDASGNLLSATQLDDPGQIEEVSDKIGADGLGLVYKTGVFSGSISLGGLTLNSQGSGDIYLAKQDLSLPLPVEWFSFTTVLQGNDVLLTWATESELNNAGFAVQQSYDGYQFQDIDFIRGHGTTNKSQNYNSIHQNVKDQAVSSFSYYRLKQIDFNGDFSYSSIQVVNLGLLSTPFEIKAVRQNYFENRMISVSYSSPPWAKKIIFTVGDINGNVIRRISEYPTEELNLLEIQLPENLRGLYFLSVHTGREIITKKVLINLD